MQTKARRSVPLKLRFRLENVHLPFQRVRLLRCFVVFGVYQAREAGKDSLAAVQVVLETLVGSHVTMVRRTAIVFCHSSAHALRSSHLCWPSAR